MKWYIYIKQVMIIPSVVIKRRNNIYAIVYRNCSNRFFFFLGMGTQNGHNVPFLESASLQKRKRKAMKRLKIHKYLKRVIIK